MKERPERVVITKLPYGTLWQFPYHTFDLYTYLLTGRKQKGSSMPSRKAFVLLSGGLDSTTCLYKAIYDYAPKDVMVKETIDLYSQKPYDTEHFKRNIDWVEAISVDYGQKHFKETQYAEKTCKLLGIEHTILDIGDVLSGKQVMLTDPDRPIPNMSYDEIKGVSPTYVPFRNGTLLSVITAHAQKWVNGQIDKLARDWMNQSPSAPRDREPGQQATEYATKEMQNSVGIYFGAHSEDAANWAYPDCTPEFIGAMANAIYIGSYQAIRLHTPLQWLMKDEIVTLGKKLGVPFENTWSCYAGGSKHCGVCPTCRSRKQAFITAGVTDPTVYAA